MTFSFFFVNKQRFYTRKSLSISREERLLAEASFEVSIEGVEHALDSQRAAREIMAEAAGDVQSQGRQNPERGTWNEEFSFPGMTVTAQSNGVGKIRFTVRASTEAICSHWRERIDAAVRSWRQPLQRMQGEPAGLSGSSGGRILRR